MPRDAIFDENHDGERMNGEHAAAHEQVEHRGAAYAESRCRKCGWQMFTHIAGCPDLVVGTDGNVWQRSVAEARGLVARKGDAA